MEEDLVFTKRFIDCVKKPHSERSEEVSVSLGGCEAVYGLDLCKVTMLEIAWGGGGVVDGGMEPAAQFKCVCWGVWAKYWGWKRTYEVLRKTWGTCWWEGVALVFFRTSGDMKFHLNCPGQLQRFLSAWVGQRVEVCTGEERDVENWEENWWEMVVMWGNSRQKLIGKDEEDSGSEWVQGSSPRWA